MSLKIRTGTIKRRRASIGELINHSKPPISVLVDGPTTPTPRSLLFDGDINPELAGTTNTPKGGFFNEAPYKLKIATKNGEPLEIAAKDFAKQITLISSTYFRAIKRKELEQMGWTGNSKKTLSPSIVKITTHFNQLAHFTAQKIVEAEKIQTRLQILIFFIHVANYCLQYDNYDGVKSIVSGLQSTPVHRLNKSWALVGRKEREMFIKLQHIVSLDNNHEMYNLSDCRYRRKIGSANPPLIPYLGIHLTDFTYIYECLKKDKDKAERKAQYKERFDQFNQMLDEIAQMQSSCFYSFPLDFKFTDSLEQEYSVNEDDQKAATESQYELSYKWEPRGEAMQKSDDWRQTILSPKNLFAVPDGIMKNLAGMNPMPSHSRGESETAKSTTPVAKKKSRNNENPSSMGDSVIEAIPENPIILIDEEEPLEWADRPASVRKRLLNLIGMGSGKKKSRPVSVGDDAFVNEDLLRSYTQESHSSSRKYSNLEGKRELEIRTTATAMPPSIATPKPPSELRGKLHIQAILYKKEEFDEEGNRSTDRHWAPFKIVLDGTKLTITPHDSEPPQKQSSLPLSFVTGGEKDSPSLVKQKSIKPPISPYTSGSLKETKSQSRLPLQNLFKNLEIGSSSSSSTSIPTNSNTLSPIEKSTAIILPVPVPAKALYEKAETRARTFSFPNPIVKSDSIEINPSQFLHQEEPKSDLRRKPDLKPNRKTPAPLMSIESGVSVFNAPVEHQDSSSGLLSSQPKPQQETRHRTTSFPTPMAKQDSIPEAIPYMLQEEPKSSIQRKPVLKPNRKVSTAAVVDSGPRKSIIPPTLSAQPSGGDFKILQSSLFTRSISSDFFKPVDKNTEIFQLDHFARVNRVEDHKKRFVFRAMIQKQRSFLVRAQTESELELWIQAIRMAIEVFKHGNI